MTTTTLKDRLIAAVKQQQQHGAAAPPAAPTARSKPGQPAAAKKFLDRKPAARVIGAKLLEDLVKANKLAELITASPPALDATSTTSSLGEESEGRESVATETRCATLRRSTLACGHCSHRAPRITKHVTFYGTDGSECTHVIFYEAVKVKLPWTGPRNGERRSGQWLRREAHAAAAAGIRPRFM